MAQYAPFCEKQVEYLTGVLKPSNWLNIAEGGKRAGKNVLNIIAWCEILETHPEHLHLAAGVSNSTAKLNIIDSNGFGLLNHFKGRCRQGKYQDKDALIVQTKTGEKVILIAGGGRDGDEKLIKGFTLGSVYITEANECAQAFVKECFDRTLSSARRKILFDLNPKFPSHWFYEEILDMHQAKANQYPNYGFNYAHFTLHDNLSFSDEKITEIIRTYTRNTVWYKRDILGQRTSAEGIIYDMFSPGNQYKDYHPKLDLNLYYKRYFVIDYGTTNPFVILEIIEQKDLITGITYYFVVNEYYYDSKKHNRQKEDSEYVEELIKMIDGRRYTSIILDPSAASFKIAARNKGLHTRDADNEVLDGIHLVASLLRLGRLFIDIANCPNIVREFASYIWNEKSSERGKEEPVKENDHALDALRYFCKTIIRAIRG